MPAVSEQDRVRIRTMAENGLSPGVIALRTGVNPRTVRYHMAELGIGPTSLYAYKDRIRLGRPVFAFTEAEDAAIQDLSLQGVSNHAIAGQMNVLFPGRPRRANAIRQRLQTLARVAEADE